MLRFFLPWLAKPPEARIYACGMSQVEWELFRRITKDPEQRRKDVVCDRRLCAAARAKAEACRQVNDVLHTIDGVGANANVIAHGYKLPAGYADPEVNPNANNVESLAVGQRTAAEVVEAWRHSAEHCDHVFGAGTYAGQDRMGVAYSARPSRTGWAHWWVVITAHRES